MNSPLGAFCSCRGVRGTFQQMFTFVIGISCGNTPFVQNARIYHSCKRFCFRLDIFRWKIFRFTRCFLSKTFHSFTLWTHRCSHVPRSPLLSFDIFLRKIFRSHISYAHRYNIFSYNSGFNDITNICITVATSIIPCPTITGSGFLFL